MRPRSPFLALLAVGVGLGAVSLAQTFAGGGQADGQVIVPGYLD